MPYRWNTKALVVSCFLAMGLAGCASPLFVDGATGAPGTVPRDEMGEPIWDQIAPGDAANNPGEEKWGE
ncbi:MAG: hypothetical protein ACOY99_05395 [Pseudomonadota bacterium]